MCSANCPTQDHKTWGACVRAKHIHEQWLGGEQPSYKEQKRFSKVNEDFRTMVSLGVMPKEVSRRCIIEAEQRAEKGVPKWQLSED